LVDSLEDLKKIVLKRSKLEEWVDEQFNFFYDTVVGTWVRFNYKGKDRIAYVISAREEDENHNYLPLYTLGKKKTNI
jgi:Plus-3 domain